MLVLLYFWPVLEHFAALSFPFFTILKWTCLKLKSSFFPVYFLSQSVFSHFPDNSDLWKVVTQCSPIFLAQVQDFLRPGRHICLLAFLHDSSLCVCLGCCVPSIHFQSTVNRTTDYSTSLFKTSVVLKRNLLNMFLLQIFKDPIILLLSYPTIFPTIK